MSLFLFCFKQAQGIIWIQVYNVSEIKQGSEFASENNESIWIKLVIKLWKLAV